MTLVSQVAPRLRGFQRKLGERGIAAKRRQRLVVGQAVVIFLMLLASSAPVDMALAQSHPFASRRVQGVGLYSGPFDQAWPQVNTTRPVEILAFRAEGPPLQLLSFELPFSLPIHDRGPIQLRAQVQNRGSVPFTAPGKVQIIDLFGNQVTTIALSPNRVEQGETRTLSAEWADPPPIAFLFARLTFEGTGLPLVAEDHLLMLPWLHVLGALLFGIVLCLLMTWRTSRLAPGPPAKEKDSPSAIQATLRSHLARYSEGLQVTANRSPAEGHASEPTEIVNGGQGLGSSASQAGPAQHAADNSQPSSAQLEVLELLRLGQQIARAGDRETSYQLFSEAATLDPDSEEAWLWRAATSDQPEEAVRSLERVLSINPDNARARRGLSELKSRLAP